MSKRQKRYYSQKGRRSFLDNPLTAGIVLIVISFLLVYGNKLLGSDKSRVGPSYGAPNDSASVVKQAEAPVIRQSEAAAGTEIDEYHGVAVYSNGPVYLSSHGLNYSIDGYYYGYRWQCVEFVKRYYYEIFRYKMPDGAGNAKYFFNPMLAQGEVNEQRGLVQYHNGGDMRPKIDDILVFADGSYGHVAIVCKVQSDWLEVIQQNSEVTRERYKLKVSGGKFTVSGERDPIGWLRLQ